MYIRSGELVIILGVRKYVKINFLRSLRFRVMVLIILAGIIPSVIMRTVILKNYEKQAVEMLRSLMGHTHKVVTGVTLTSTHVAETFSETTEVTFGNISDREIELYVSKFRPLDKAGAYGIQEWIGCVAIQGIRGCFYNVMGLPLHTLYRRLHDFKV